MIWLIPALIAIIILLLSYIRSVNRQIREAAGILDDIYNGNLDRRLLAGSHSPLSPIIYKINRIVIQDKQKLLAVTRSEKAYKKLVTSLSHDVRTPLASLTGYLEALERDALNEEEQNRFLRTARSKTLDLSEYIQSLFEWLKLESGEWSYHLETIDICEQTRLILAGWILRLEEHGIGYHFDLPDQAVLLTTDRAAWERIINNLLSNVQKHSQADQLKISLSSRETGISLRVCDNGTGISAEDLPFIFDRLYRCDHARSTNSSGLGLAITRELVTALNGTITVDSTMQKGTAFCLSFPKT